MPAANYAVAAAGRRADWLRAAGSTGDRGTGLRPGRPLADLEPGHARVFPALPADGVAGVRHRAATAAR